MTNLEFVNQNILECKGHIEYLEAQIIEDKKYPSFVKAHKERIKELKLILNHLEQIKSVLEAWEVIEKYCDYQDYDRFNCISEGFYLTELIKDKDYLTIKKALEAKDE